MQFFFQIQIGFIWKNIVFTFLYLKKVKNLQYIGMYCAPEQAHITNSGIKENIPEVAVVI